MLLNQFLNTSFIFVRKLVAKLSEVRHEFSFFFSTGSVINQMKQTSWPRKFIMFFCTQFQRVLLNYPIAFYFKCPPEISCIFIRPTFFKIVSQFTVVCSNSCLLR